MSNKVYRVDFETLEKFMQQALVKVGVPEEDAVICADVLVTADKLGIDSHGVNRLKPIYIDRINDGILNPVTNFEVVREGPTTAVIDGHDGMGHVISYKANKMAIEKAKKFGLGMVVVRNSSHYGIAGYYGLMAEKEGMIGITGTNARPSIAPTFGVENMLGTNPLTFVMPSDEEFPFFLDCATSVSQRGKIEYWARNGMEAPAGVVIGRDGQAMTDSNAILEALVNGQAALAPLGGIGEDTGGYKGYGYAAVVEILSAALQGGTFLKALSGFENGKKVPYSLGHFFIAINIEAFIELDEFKKITGDILRDLRNSQKMAGEERIFTAGEKEYISYCNRVKNGVPVNEKLKNEIQGLIEKLALKDIDMSF